jgi:hypothetical protein
MKRPTLKVEHLDNGRVTVTFGQWKAVRWNNSAPTFRSFTVNLRDYADDLTFTFARKSVPHRQTKGWTVWRKSPRWARQYKFGFDSALQTKSVHTGSAPWNRVAPHDQHRFTFEPALITVITEDAVYSMVAIYELRLSDYKNGRQEAVVYTRAWHRPEYAKPDELINLDGEPDVQFAAWPYPNLPEAIAERVAAHLPSQERQDVPEGC